MLERVTEFLKTKFMRVKKNTPLPDEAIDKDKQTTRQVKQPPQIKNNSSSKAHFNKITSSPGKLIMELSRFQIIRLAQS
ncbi:MAG: hypothetical protein MK033_07715 [Candidatus Caenarcaniphilales bacterium]|nr:hypothetical protein [Candidatus Caenarcaniphilales bacterium]